MTVALLWTDRAKRRTADRGDFIAQRDPSAAALAIVSLFDRVAVLADHPELGSVFPGSPTDNARSLYVDPYRVYYVFHKSDAAISILMVRHAREAPISSAVATDDDEP